jgi:hypothetical protein
MRQTRLIALAGAFAIILIAIYIFPHLVRGHGQGTATGSAPVYDPYPPGILPSDLNSEFEYKPLDEFRDLRAAKQPSRTYPGI